MSWILGFIGQAASPTFRRTVEKLHPIPLHRIEEPSLYIAAGGVAETCLAGSFGPRDQTSAAGWIVVGCGIELHSGCCDILSAPQWADILSSPNPNLERLDGHFIAVRWHNDKIICRSDLFGLRTLYFTKVDRGVAFSTRLDWLARLRGHAEIDLEQFGGHWRAFNQLSFKSLVKGIERLAPNSTAIATPEAVSMSGEVWTPDVLHPHQSESRLEIPLILRSFLHPRTSGGMQTSLGLSGGLDSRLLFALDLSDSDRTLCLHLFGDHDEPDVRVSQRIAADMGIRQRFYCEPIPSLDESVRMLREYIPASSLVSTASSMLKLRYYPKIYAERKLVIDGGMGEIGRRQFMNRLLLRGRKPLRKGNAVAISKLISVHRPPVLSVEAEATMQAGIQRQISSAWDAMPKVEDIGEENFVDLLTVRYRFPNYGGMEQARMDEHVVSFMPFAQPSFVRAAFAVPLELRRNGRLYRHLINTINPRLKRYPLVKGFTTYPYVMTTFPAMLWTALKSTSGRQIKDRIPVEFLKTISEFVLDNVHSTSVRSFSLYDHKATVSLVERFYAGSTELAGEVDWWLALEIWRQSLGAV